MQSRGRKQSKSPAFSVPAQGPPEVPRAAEEQLSPSPFPQSPSVVPNLI